MIVIEFGYEIPFIDTPPFIHFRNNKSAINNTKFVDSEISQLLENGCVIQVPFKPHVVSPLSVAEKKTKRD